MYIRFNSGAIGGGPSASAHVIPRLYKEAPTDPCHNYQASGVATCARNHQEHQRSAWDYKIRVITGIGDAMSCRLCSSANEAGFTAEMMIHFSDRKHLENPGVLTFSEILVCLDCGSTRFRIAETELKLLREGYAALTTAEHEPLGLSKAS